MAYVDTMLRAGELDLDLMAKHLDLADAPPRVPDPAEAPVVLRRSIEDLVRRGERDLRRLTERSRELVEQLSRPSDGGDPALPIDENRPLAIMFTDVDGSTAITERLGDHEARRVLRSSEDLVRGAVVAHGGRTVRHTGDGCMACFPSASQALECALMIEREHEVRNRVAGVPLTLRIGINAGEPVLDGSGLLGLAVHVAECIIRETAPGEVLVSDVVRQLAAGKGFRFEDRGWTQLGELSEPVRLYAVLGR
jgi:class 3 adenylate cyclase